MARMIWNAGSWLVIAALIGWWLVRAISNVRGGDDFPNRPITIVVPYAVGGGSDTFVRKLQIGIVEDDLLPQPLVVRNQPGGSGTIGSRAVKNARPDGYTLLCHHNAIIATKLSGVVGYGPEAFEPIALTGELTMVVLVREDSPFAGPNGLDAMLREAARRPREITFGANKGSPAYLTTLQLEKQVPGAEFSIVSADGGADRNTKILGGHLDAGIFSLSEYLDFRRPDDTPASRNIRAVAVLSPERHESIPDVPTSVEQGIPVLLSNANYWWAPKGTPRPVVNYLADVLEQAMRNEMVREELQRLRVDLTYMRGEPFLARLAETIARFEAVVAAKETRLPNFPLWTGILVAVLLGFVLMERESRVSAAKTWTPRPKLAAACFLGLTGYVALLWLGWLPFAILSSAMVFAVGGLISGWRAKFRLNLAKLALLTGFGAEFVFTKVFAVTLP